MKELIEWATQHLVEIIESKRNSRDVARQFVLEELDAARHGSAYVRDRILSFYINPNEYAGALQASWSDVDGPLGPQQFLLRLTADLSNQIEIEAAAAIRLSIVEHICRRYQFGRFYLDSATQKTERPPKLFEPTAEETRLHPHFKVLLEEEFAPVREVLCRWASGFEDRDRKLGHEFQTTFNSSFWEIYLYQCFKDLKFDVDFTKAAPDFCIKTTRGELFCVEAVTANHAQDSDPEWSKLSGQSLDQEVFLKFACIRLLNALKSKHDKYIKSYSRFKHVQDKPYVVAIAPFEQPWFFAQNNEAIIRVLYAQGIDPKKRFETVETPAVLKNGATPLELGIFTTEKFAEISAVLFSTVATIGKVITQTPMDRIIRVSRYHKRRGLLMNFLRNSQHHETHLDGLQVHHNPYARISLDPKLFDPYEVTHYFYDTKARIIDNQQKSYTIISRNTLKSGAS